MPAIEKISIALPAEMVGQIKESVEAGEYASSSEAVRDALRDWNEKRTLRRQGMKALRKMWRQAVEDRSPGVEPAKVLDRLEAKYRAMAGSAER